jgi:hypothetical protein
MSRAASTAKQLYALELLFLGFDRSLHFVHALKIEVLCQLQVGWRCKEGGSVRYHLDGSLAAPDQPLGFSKSFRVLRLQDTDEIELCLGMLR